MSDPANAPDTCPDVAPAHFSQSGARCEREPHGPDVNHKVAPTADKPGAVWATKRGPSA